MIAPGATLRAVTGTYGYSGKYIAQRLLTLTNSLCRRSSPQPSPGIDQQVHPGAKQHDAGRFRNRMGHHEIVVW